MTELHYIDALSKLNDINRVLTTYKISEKILSDLSDRFTFAGSEEHLIRMRRHELIKDTESMTQNDTAVAEYLKLYGNNYKDLERVLRLQKTYPFISIPSLIVYFGENNAESVIFEFIKDQKCVTDSDNAQAQQKLQHAINFCEMQDLRAKAKRAEQKTREIEGNDSDKQLTEDTKKMSLM